MEPKRERVSTPRQGKARSTTCTSRLSLCSAKRSAHQYHFMCVQMKSLVGLSQANMEDALNALSRGRICKLPTAASGLGLSMGYHSHRSRRIAWVTRRCSTQIATRMNVIHHHHYISGITSCANLPSRSKYSPNLTASQDTISARMHPSIPAHSSPKIMLTMSLLLPRSQNAHCRGRREE